MKAIKIEKNGSPEVMKIEEITLDYAFALKISGKLNPGTWNFKNRSYLLIVSRLMGLAQINLANKGGKYDK